MSCIYRRLSMTIKGSKRLYKSYRCFMNTIKILVRLWKLLEDCGSFKGFLKNLKGFKSVYL